MSARVGAEVPGVAKAEGPALAQADMSAHVGAEVPVLAQAEGQAWPWQTCQPWLHEKCQDWP